MSFLQLKTEARIAGWKFDNLMTANSFAAGSYISPTDADIAEAGPEWKKGHKYYFDQPLPVFGFIDEFGKIQDIPKMEVEELEVINIELSDYPLPENPTTYDWWWA